MLFRNFEIQFFYHVFGKITNITKRLTAYRVLGHGQPTLSSFVQFLGKLLYWHMRTAQSDEVENKCQSP